MSYVNTKKLYCLGLVQLTCKKLLTGNVALQNYNDYYLTISDILSSKQLIKNEIKGNYLNPSLNSQFYVLLTILLNLTPFVNTEYELPSFIKQQVHFLMANSSPVSLVGHWQPMPSKSLLFVLGFSALLAPLALLALQVHSCVDFPAKKHQFPLANRPLHV